MARAFKLNKSLTNILKTFRSIDNHGYVSSVDIHTFSLNGKHVLRSTATEFVKHTVVKDEVSPLPKFVDNLHDNEKTKNFLGEDLAKIDANDKFFKRITGSLKKRKFRERKLKLVIEGSEVIETALKAGVRFEKLFYSKEGALQKLSYYENIKHLPTYKIRERTMRDLTSNTFSPEVIGICKRPTPDEICLSSSANTIPVTILCSDVRDPENMASILTIAAASGCKRILLLKGCVDVWDHKVINSASGVHFFMPIINNIQWADINQYLSDDVALYIADSSSDIDISDTQVLIESEEFVSYPLISSEKSDEVQQNTVALKDSDSSLKQLQDLPCMLYTEVTFPRKELVIYVGGETVGINNNIQELSHLPTKKIKLPLENDMDSLNVSVALSVILYEIKRQLAS